MTLPGATVVRFGAAAGFAALTGLASTPASADATKDATKDGCIEANGNAQGLRSAGKLAAAREQLRQCANPACPAMVRDDCAKRLDELEGAQPTIIFSAKDTAGRDVGAVVVTVDGRPLAERLDGTALRVDPGEHVFTFTPAGELPFTENFILREGEKGRRESLVIGRPASAAAVEPTAKPAPEGELSSSRPAQPGQGMGTRKVLGLAAAGAGVAGIAVGSVFGIMTFSKTSQQKSDCASPNLCTNRAQALQDHSAAATDGAVSTVAFIAGGALLALGAVLFFVPAHSSEQPAPTALVLLPGVTPAGGFLSLSGGF